MTQKTPLALLLLCLTAHTVCAIGSGFTPWSTRRLLNAFSSLHGGCPQGPQQENSAETMLNGHDWWEKNWGRSGAKWPRRGFQECWDNRGDVCPLPNQDHVVCLPGSRRGSTISRGWALDPKSQACEPGVHCLYACEPGYYWTTFNQAETSNFDFANAHQRGHCDGTWDYGTSTHGVYCKEDGTLEMPSQPLCKLGETFVYVENRLDQHVFLCQTVFPGHEIFLIPTLVKPGETVMITTQPINYWGGPTYGKPPHGDIYVSFAGADIMEACTWDEFSPSGAALLPYEIGTGVEDNGFIYSTHYFYQQPNSEVPASAVGYVMDLECTSSVDGVCGERVAHNNVITMVTKKKPPAGSTKLKFIFKKPETANGADYVYREPNKPHMPDPMMITGLRNNAGGASHGGYYGRKLQEAEPRRGVFIENGLTKPIVACDAEVVFQATGMTIAPGEIVQLPEDTTLAIGLRGESGRACSDTANMGWILDLDGDTQTYGFEPHPETGGRHHLMPYHLQLTCVSEDDDDDACQIETDQRVSLLPESTSNATAEVVFRVQGLKTMANDEQPSNVGAYEWGQGFRNLLAKFMR